MPNKKERRRFGFSLKKFRAKHPKVIFRTFLGLFIAGIMAGIVAFAALLGMEPTNTLNQNSFIGFFVFALICLQGYLLWFGFGPQSKGKRAGNRGLAAEAV